LTAIKGHEHLLKAIAVLRAGGLRAKLLLVGDGERRETLERLAVSEGITEQVRFLGQLRHEEVLALYRYQRFSAYVQPSVELGLGEHEGIPVSLMEAMACGVPVVATATGGIPELVQQGAGLLVPGSEPRALADALAKVIVDQGLAGRLSRGGRRRVEADFDVSKIGSELARRFETAKVPRTWP
jgi:glycosyltransferase involved in cell wall biosynthesis